MPAAPIPHDETTRLALLASCRVLDSAPEQSFDDIALVASQLAGVPIAFVSFIDTNRQWFKAKVGLPVDETPRDLSFCTHTILQREPLVVPDAQADARFVDNPLVAMGIRFYAGFPIHLDDGSAIGTLCILDFQSRTLSPPQVKGLAALTRQLTRELSARAAIVKASTETPSGLAEGDVVGRWRVRRFVASGAFGSVYEAERDDGTRAALKVLTAGGDVDRFVREARILMQLDSAHVARLLDVGNLPSSQGEHPYIALEFLDGPDLAQLLERRGRIPWREAATWLAEACEGIGGAHALGVIHRDIKPANIVLASGVVKVIDFGVAKSMAANEPALTKAEMVLGSPHYMAPEQLLSSASIDARSDVWSMGATLYELVAAQVPFEGGSELEVVARILASTPEPLRARVAGVPEDLDGLVARCLARSVDDRPASMIELAASLRVIANAPDKSP